MATNGARKEDNKALFARLNGLHDIDDEDGDGVERCRSASKAFLKQAHPRQPLGVTPNEVASASAAVQPKGIINRTLTNVLRLRFHPGIQ